MLTVLAVGVFMVLVIALLVVIFLANDDGADDDAGGGGGGGGGRVSGNVGSLLATLDIDDLNKSDGGGAWGLRGRINWKKSGVAKFQGRSALRVFYGKNSGTSQHSGVGGLGFNSVPRGLPRSGAVITFDVFFEPGWHFSKGGKICGLHIGHGAAGGGQHSVDGSSHRIMWQANGGAISYIYPPKGLPQVDKRLSDSGYGDGFFHDTFPAGTLKVGEWNHVEIGVRVNTFSNGKPNADGVAYLHVNGKTGTLNSVRWSAREDLKITEINFGTFFGGPDPAKLDCVAYYQNFKLFDWPW